MWYPISKLLLKQGKRRLFGQNQSLTTFAIIAYILFQTITFLVMYYVLNSMFPVITFQTLSMIIPWFGAIIYFVSLYIIYNTSFKIPSVLRNLPVPTFTIYKAFNIPTIAAISLLWISQVGVYLPVIIHLDLGFIMPIITYILFSAMYTVLAGITFNFILYINRFVKVNSIYIQLGMVLIMSLITGVYHVVWTQNEIAINPALWLSKVYTGEVIYILPFIVILVFSTLFLNLSYSYIKIPMPKNPANVFSIHFSNSFIGNGILFTMISFLRDKERKKSLISSNLVGLVMIIGIPLIFDTYEYVYFYFFVMVLGLGIAHVSVYNPKEENFMVKYPISYVHLLMGKTITISVIGIFLLAIALSVAVLFGYSISGSQIFMLFSALLVFISMATLLRLVFYKQGVAGETAYSMISMIGFSAILFLENNFLPRYILANDFFIEVCISLLNLIFTFSFFSMYIYIYVKSLYKGGNIRVSN